MTPAELVAVLIAAAGDPPEYEPDDTVALAAAEQLADTVAVFGDWEGDPPW